MELLIVLIGLGIFAETTYLTVRAIQPNAKTARGGIVLDTSVLIDGRILPIARSGLVGAPLIVPTSVVRELQFMADKADHDKRERARYGLEMIEQLQALSGITVHVVDDGVTDVHGVDEQLIKLSQRWQAKLCTIDYNLNKSARVQGVDVININELAHALRVTYLPGEALEVKLVQAGQDSHQAVGYLDDGTMVVVDNAKAFIGQTMTVEATRVLQTAAGKMLFARHHQQQPSKPKPQSQPRRGGESAQKSSTNRRRQTSRTSGERTAKRPRTPEDSLVDLANRQ